MDYDIEPDERVSTAVIRAVSAVEGEDPATLPPLEYVLDTDAVNALFKTRFGGQPRTGGRLSFVYSKCRISIDNGEYLTIEPLDGVGRASTNGGSDRTSTS